MTATRRRLPWLGVLTLVWVLLNGDPTLANLLGGLAVATGVLVIFPLADEPRLHRVHPVGVARFVLFVLGSLVTSSIRVLVTVLVPTPARLRAGIVRIELPGATPLVTTLVANAITLTPGTLTLTAGSNPGVLHVHVLGLGDLETFRAGVLDLQARAAAAFTPIPGGGDDHEGER
ncbi:Na+/H+ antiporter subunit E [Iamia sp.]|jgi:multicomponent Na+:H+ antiporter subunit E|uniref:Na+/H+ antiporter subunit E n=1 Tax=Iamia sp. TaxID=2722710 RepID=UPI002CF28319|nr:Na+/H+ antiporter subunit E [Iamia sp.]HXH57509.1 Na+/H+ antiporter subunit E [Iamia sp.]